MNLYIIRIKKGYICKGTDGITKIKKWWNGYSAEIDFSNPDAVRWFKEKLDYLCDTYGIDGFKFDAGDIFQSLECEKPFYEYLKGYQTVGESFKFNEFRASFNAGGRALAQRECDKHHRWTNGGIEDLVPDGLAQGILGCPYNCADMIGGGEFTIFYENSDSGNSDVFDGEIIIRYAQAAALFPMMQYSFSPWRILKDHDLEYALEAEKIHLKFSDYIYECAKTASKTGEPIMRYLEYSYPNKGYEKITDEFLLGEDILVAPVYQKSVFRRKVQLPDGIWEADDGTVYEGNSEIEIDVPLSRLPYFIKQG